MRPTILALLLFTFSVLPAHAQLNHPDLLDANSWFGSPDPKTADDNSAAIVQNESSNFAYGSIAGVSGPSSSGIEYRISWSIYEPDTVKRSFKRARLEQGSYVQFGFSSRTTHTYNNISSQTTILEGCKASTVVNGAGGTPTDAKWKASCKGALETMGLSQGQQDALVATLGKSINAKKDKISISGKGPATN